MLNNKYVMQPKDLKFKVLWFQHGVMHLNNNPFIYDLNKISK